MGMIKRDFSNDYSKGNLTLLEYPATEFREHLVNNTVYSSNKNINAAAQVATVSMLRRTVQGMKHGDTRAIKLYTVVCEPLTADDANTATFKQYRFANAVTGAISAALAFLVVKKLPKSIQEDSTKKAGVTGAISLVIGPKIRKYLINNMRKFNAGDVAIMTFIEVNGGIGPQYSFTGTHLTLDEY
jgi:hypothetical protein